MSSPPVKRLDEHVGYGKSRDHKELSVASGSPESSGSRLTTIQVELEKLFQDAFDKAFPALQERPVIAPTKEPKFGDYQCNSAMKLFGLLKGKVLILPFNVSSTAYLLKVRWDPKQPARQTLPSKTKFGPSVQEGAPKNPRAVGEAIVKNLAATDLLAEKPSLAGPGFINIRINAKWLGKRVADILSKVCASLLHLPEWTS